MTHNTQWIQPSDTGQENNPATLAHQPAVSSQPVIAVSHLTKTYHLGDVQVPALRGITLTVHQGEFLTIMGPSGSGKSTLMNLLGCLERPTSGEYWLDGVPVSSMNADELADIRNRHIGFVFQGFNLLSRYTALENVMLPMMYAGITHKQQVQRAKKALRLVGLDNRIKHLPAQLSGGQQQRVAIARALINYPTLLLADEPTGNLDSRTSLEILALLQRLNCHGITIVLVTHNPEVIDYARRQVLVRDGRIVQDEPVIHQRSAHVDWTTLVQQGTSDNRER